MSLKRNTLATYVSQFYTTLIGIVMLPLYVKYLGAEAYGLVGFYAMLQVWFQMLDMGLTSTMARETARYSGGATDALKLRRLLRALEGIFIAVAVVGAAAMMAGSGAIASRWLNVQQLPLEEVQQAVGLMGATVALRWISGLYRGAISGFERLVWLGAFSGTIATARFVLVIPFFIYVGTSPTHFFSYQLALAVLEVVALVIQTYRLLPRAAAGQWVPWQWEPLRGVLKFALSIAFTSSVWVLLTQTDKLVLSKLLPLTDYAYFVLAVLMASGVMIVSGPISGALLPRLTRLNAEGNEAGMVRLYRNATQLVGVITVPCALVLAFFAQEVLWVWTGNAQIASIAAPVLSLYALGNGVLALAAFPYYLQFAKGDLKLHLIGNALFLVLFLPTLVWATRTFGMIGAGYTWLIANLIPFALWLPIVHRRFVKGLHVLWLWDVVPIVGMTVVAATLIHLLVRWPQARLPGALGVGLVSLVLLSVAATGSSWMREIVVATWRTRFSRPRTANGSS